MVRAAAVRGLPGAHGQRREAALAPAGKLTGAARHFVRLGSGRRLTDDGHDRVAKQLEAFRAPAAIRKRWTRAQEKNRQPFAVFPANWDAVQLFLRVSSQLVRAGMEGVPVAIDHAAVWPMLAAMRGAGALLTPDQPDLAIVDRFLVMEREVIAALRKVK
ncbi:MAG: DUF1799 domain-containing protein [Gammaproteobacteria bacterium]|nr:DUF1799 domain-containing protein [Gammaproteobacteria bacterium]